MDSPVIRRETASQRDSSQPLGERDREAVDRDSIASLTARLRSAVEKPLSPDKISRSLSRAFILWRDPNYQRRRRAIDRIAANSGLSVELLAESLDALLLPFPALALESLAAKVKVAPRVIGFVMPGNVAGAGIHEFAQALIAGAAVLVKTASAEPVFFAEFARTIAEVSSELAARVAVIAFRRENDARIRAMQRSCDELVVLGEDDTVEILGRGGPVIGFGSRLSGVLLAREAVAPELLGALSDMVARDVTLFEQRGCLSPHHIFVEDETGAEGSRFAEHLALSLEQLARRLPSPAAIDIGAAAAIRATREGARWRKLGGAPVDLWEGVGFGWTVIYDPTSSFSVSPQYRTIFVTPFSDFVDFTSRLEKVRGHLEAFAIADPAERLAQERSWLRDAGVSHFAAPGMMQSPPLEWPHGNGVFLSRVLRTNE
jgi:hypothetical protein